MQTIEMNASTYFSIKECDITPFTEQEYIFKVSHSFIKDKLLTIDINQLIRECNYSGDASTIREILKDYREFSEYVPGEYPYYMDILHMYCHLFCIKSTYVEFTPEDKFMLDTLFLYCKEQ